MLFINLAVTRTHRDVPDCLRIKLIKNILFIHRILSGLQGIEDDTYDYTMLIEDFHTGQYFMPFLSKTLRISELLSPSLESLKLRWLFEDGVVVNTLQGFPSYKPRTSSKHADIIFKHKVQLGVALKVDEEKARIQLRQGRLV